MNTCFFKLEMQNEYEEISKHDISDINKAYLDRETFGINNVLDEFLERCRFDREDDSCPISQREMYSIQQQDILMDSFFIRFILSTRDNNSHDEPNNFINYLYGFHIVSRNNNIFLQLRGYHTKSRHFNDLVSEIYKGKKEINSEPFSETKWLSALRNLRQLVELKNIRLDSSFVPDLGTAFTENE
ncbi:hypothetical protein C6P45_004723 [Maudiozyma exigua]|uniref:Uncharacterized protein n=1 Tax=Maudiozyma exigua TaxID=34358 RepID=A0A9P6WC97_MAUEX|nr:hypothetical protein C6P45_004723 [Kazachstania exigua]